MNELDLPQCSKELTARLDKFGVELLKKYPEFVFPMEHFLHGGMYVRTIKMPKGTVGIGAFIKVPTVVVINGHLRLNSGEKVYEVKGYKVLKGQAQRKQMAVALEDSEFTMMFATQAKTLEEAEKEFTDDFERLQNHKKEIEQ